MGERVRSVPRGNRRRCRQCIRSLQSSARIRRFWISVLSRSSVTHHTIQHKSPALDMARVCIEWARPNVLLHLEWRRVLCVRHRSHPSLGILGHAGKRGIVGADQSGTHEATRLRAGSTDCHSHCKSLRAYVDPSSRLYGKSHNLIRSFCASCQLGLQGPSCPKWMVIVITRPSRRDSRRIA